MNSIEEAVSSIGLVLKGKESQIKLALCCLFADGHLLIEDLPGMGKTILAAAIAKVSGLSHARVQFTSDMLPADIIGSTIYEKETGKFSFHQGPIFTQVFMADEINRTTPKTQSALLEAMQKGKFPSKVKPMHYPKHFLLLLHKILLLILERFLFLNLN